MCVAVSFRLLIALMSVSVACAAFSPECCAAPDEKPAAAAAPAVPRAAADADPPLAPLHDQLQKLLKPAVALNPEQTVFLDRRHKRLLVRTQVACTDCLLEMLCCTEQTKEHESILWMRGRAYVVHAGLLALGMQPGSPAQFSPEFVAPSGPEVKITMHWMDAEGKRQSQDARKWMRTSVSHYFSAALPAPPPGIKLPLMELRYDPFNKEILWFGRMTTAQRDKLLKLWDDAAYQQAIKKFYKESQTEPMTADFVFAGSYMAARSDEGEKFYAAEDGYLICVANFAGSMIDVREASSASDGGQTYEADPAKVPPRGTPVILELSPVPPKADAENQAAPKADAPARVEDSRG